MMRPKKQLTKLQKMNRMSWSDWAFAAGSVAAYLWGMHWFVSNHLWAALSLVLLWVAGNLAIALVGLIALIFRP